MIVERHYDDEALIAILGTEGDRARDPHLAGCSSCAETLSSYRAIADVLGSDAVWDLKDLRRDSAPDSVGVLRAFAARLNNEDESAEDLVAELLVLPRAQWLTTVQSDGRFVNPGVVRLLVEKSEQTYDKTPPEAAAMVRAAVDIAGRLDSQQLKGLAWRQYAQVLFSTGDFVGALDAVDLAQVAYEKCAVADYNLARVGIIRALIFSAQERFDEAHVTARRSVRTFRAYGDRSRVASAMVTEAYILMRQLRFSDAIPVLLELAREYRNDLDGYAQGAAVSNLAMCYAETRCIPEALAQYQLAAEIFEEHQVETEATRVRGHVANLLAAQGHYVEAKRRMRQCIDDFERLGMSIEAAMGGIYLAEVLLAENAYQEVDLLCHRAVDQFRKSGVPQIAEALAAVTYLQEAARSKRATVAVARHVKTYLEQLPSRPELLFAPPPLPPE